MVRTPDEKKRKEIYELLKNGIKIRAVCRELHASPKLVEEINVKVQIDLAKIEEQKRIENQSLNDKISELIRNSTNPIIKEYLNSKTTLINYFETKQEEFLTPYRKEFQEKYRILWDLLDVIGGVSECNDRLLFAKMEDIEKIKAERLKEAEEKLEKVRKLIA